MNSDPNLDEEKPKPAEINIRVKDQVSTISR